MLRRLSVLFGVVALVATAAPPAQSLSPERLDTFTEDLSGTDPCDGFDIVSSGTLTIRVTAYFDNAGTPVRVHVHASRDQRLTSSVTGEWIELRGHVFVVIDLTTGWESWLGQVIMSNERGLGSVIQDTGRIVFDSDFDVAFIAGPHDGITNPELFCSTLA